MRKRRFFDTSSDGLCRLCRKRSPLIARAVGVCIDCLQARFAEARPHLRLVHAASRAEFNLPAWPPRQEAQDAEQGAVPGLAQSETQDTTQDTAHGEAHGAAPCVVQCTLCANECYIREGERGYCGLRTVRQGQLIHLAGTPARGLLHWYRDPLPTNCVADWVCEGGLHPDCHNLAVFYSSCTSNCLFCQNWHFREASPEHSKTLSAAELAAAATSRTFCVCYFGGDPASQMPHALSASKLLAQRGVRICWETNGMMHPKLLDAAVQYSLETGGCIKFDLKAFDENLHWALTGVSNQRTLENFARAARRFEERPGLPLVVASTLLVPGYVEPEQVGKIAQFIASQNPQIPYGLLAFAPHFYLPDLPCTSKNHALEAEAAARAAGLTNVRIGNRHLLGMGWETW